MPSGLGVRSLRPTALFTVLLTFSCIATGFPLSTKNWVCDSGSTTHVCCDHTMFSPAEGSTISSIGGMLLHWVMARLS